MLLLYTFVFIKLIMSWSNKSSILRQKFKQLGFSRGSQLTSLGDSGSRINTSFDLDTSIIQTNYQLNLSLLSNVTPIRAKIADRKVKGKLDYAKKNYLTKVLMNRALNVRLALKKMEDIPTALFRRGVNFQIARKLVMKSKATLQISVMRTLLFDLDDKDVQVTKLQMEHGNNIFVLPTTAEKKQHKSNAIVKLNNLLRDNLRQIIRQFTAHRDSCLTLRRYLAKYFTNFVQKRKTALFVFKMLPEAQNARNYGETQLNKLASIIETIEERSLRLKTKAFNAIILRGEIIKIKQSNVAKLIFMCSRLRKEQGFRFWKIKSLDLKRQQEESQKIEKAKLEALLKIIQRSYLKLFKKISRRVYTASKAAARLGCCSKINQQKSLWRLLLNARNSKK